MDTKWESPHSPTHSREERTTPCISGPCTVSFWELLNCLVPLSSSAWWESRAPGGNQSLHQAESTPVWAPCTCALLSNPPLIPDRSLHLCCCNQMSASSFFLSLIPFGPRVWESLKGNFQIPGSPLEDLALHSQIGIHPTGQVEPSGMTRLSQTHH